MLQIFTNLEENHDFCGYIKSQVALGITLMPWFLSVVIDLMMGMWMVLLCLLFYTDTSAFET